MGLGLEKQLLNSQNKLFKKSDVLVYALVIVCVFFLFLFFVIIPSSSQQRGFSIWVEGNKVAEYYYEGQSLSINDRNFEDKIYFDSEKLTITVYYDQAKTQYNVISIDHANKSAKISEANCSVSKDCVYTPSLNGDSAIVCAPHKLKITSLGDLEKTSPVTGGVR